MPCAPSALSTARSGRAMSPTNRLSPVSTAQGSSLRSEVDQRERRVLGPVPGRVERPDRDAPELELPAVVERLVVVVGRGLPVDVDRGARRRGEPAVARHVVGVVVRLEDVLDVHAEEAGEPQVLVDVEPRIDHGGDARVLVADQVAGAAEVVMDELAEDHPPTLAGARRATLRALRARPRAPLRRPCRARGRASSAAPTKSRNSGCGRSGRDLNSGWYCDATKNGWSGSSITSTRRSSGEVPLNTSPAVLEPLAQVVVHLVAVAVALVDDGLAVDLAGARVVVQLHGVRAEPHRAAHVAHLLLLRQEVDHRERRLRVELGRVGARPCRPRGGRTRRPRSACRGRCRGTAPRSRARSGRPGSCPRSRARRSRRARGCRRRWRARSATSPSVSRSLSTHTTSTLAAVVRAGVVERLDHRQVGVGQLVVLADERDPHGVGGRLDALDEPLPVGQVRRAAARCRSASSTASSTPSCANSSGTL